MRVSRLVHIVELCKAAIRCSAIHLSLRTKDLLHDLLFVVVIDWSLKGVFDLTRALPLARSLRRRSGSFTFELIDGRTRYAGRSDNAAPLVACCSLANRGETGPAIGSFVV